MDCLKLHGYRLAVHMPIRSTVAYMAAAGELGDLIAKQELYFDYHTMHKNCFTGLES